MNLTTDFALKHFACKSGDQVPNDLIDNAKKLAVALQQIQDTYGSKLTLNSVYRSQKHNQLIGGKKASFHLKCMAADIKVDDLNRLLLVIVKLMNEGTIPKGGLKKYNTFIHYDIRGQYVTW